MRMLQIVGVKGPSWSENGYANTFDGFQGESDIWADLDTDLYHWTKALRPVQVFICLVFVLRHCETSDADSCLEYLAVVSWSHCKSRKGTEGAAQVDGCCD